MKKMNRPIEELRAGARFRDSIISQSDSRTGTAPLWHGWAIMDAFLAGIDYANEQNKLAHKEPPKT